MKRTSPWVFVAAAAVQLAAMGFAVWIMENERRRDGRDDAPEMLAATPPPMPHPTPLFGPPPEAATVPAAPAVAPPPPAATARPTAHIEAMFRADVPPFIRDAAEVTTQVLRAETAGGTVVFGFFPDGNIRFVDVDGACYEGRSESARARMREVDGTRAFTVQVGVAADGRLTATFAGGAHDSATLMLDRVVDGSVA